MSSTVVEIGVLEPKLSKIQDPFPQNGQPVDKMSSSAPNHGMLKYFSLVALTLQNAVLILVLRYIRTRSGDMFMSSTAVICAEFLKMSISLVIVLVQSGGLKAWLRYLYENTIDQPMDCFKISVPSIIYVIQNNLLYVAISNLDAVTYQITYQLKILTTAIFSVFMLNRLLGRLQWVALVILFAGVSVVQLQPDDKASGDKVATEQRPMLGLIAVLISCFLSGFAGVYFEKILKGTKQSIWLRNVQLGFLGVIIGLITMCIKDGGKVTEKGFFFGYDYVVFFSISVQSFGGLMVAVVVKYADNILKGFATSASIVLSCAASMYFFDFHLTTQFTVGAVLVMGAIYMYSKFVPIPVADKQMH